MRLIAFCTFLFCSSIAAQIGGSNTYQFLELSPSPRHMALGTWISTLSPNSIHSGLVNPAMVSDSVQGQVVLNYQPYFAGINRGTAAAVFGLKEGRSILVDTRFVHYGTFDETDNFGDKIGEFSGNEVALGVAYAHHFPSKNIFVGARLNLISSTLAEYNSTGFTADLGVYHTFPSSRYRFSLVARNIGSQISTYDSVKESLPFSLSFGISNELEYLPLRWHLSIDQLQNWNLAYVNPNQQQTDFEGELIEQNPSFFDELFRHLVFGAELFPERAFSMQFGYNFLRSAELSIAEVRSFSGLSFGFGINLRKFRFNYSHARFSAAGNTNFLGLTFVP
ncbi:MAG: type IX secretion system protein PorQ [Flavobacteriaceae bacterium]|nr:type IX secretion system protein PorQ [Flavobacteriaceae bacterium]NCF30579.1 type IX secretion system protein PorQ [Bacteroidota bacterium]